MPIPGFKVAKEDSGDAPVPTTADMGTIRAAALPAEVVVAACRILASEKNYRAVTGAGGRLTGYLINTRKYQVALGARSGQAVTASRERMYVSNYLIVLT